MKGLTPECVGGRGAQPLLVALLAGLIVAVLILGSVPPVDRDALTHHLLVPKLYLQHGGIFQMPWIEFSYYPMNLELLYMLPLYFGNDVAPKWIHFAFALLTAGLVFRYLRDKIHLRYGLLGALAFLSVPVIIKLSITVYVDLGLVFFSTTTLLALLRWADNDFQWRHLIFAAVSCGLALGTKYNGLIVLFCTALLVPPLYVRGGESSTARQLRAVGMGAVFVLIAGLVFSPWMVRDYAWTGNPVYPLYDKAFNPPSLQRMQPTSPAKDSEADGVSATPQPGLGHFRMRKLVYGESGLEILAIPLRIFFQGKDDDPQYFDGKLNPLLLLLSILVVAGWRGGGAGTPVRDEKVLLGFAALYLMAAYLQTDMRVRWIAPIVPPLVITAMMGVRRMELGVRNAPHPVQRAVFGSAASGAILLMIGLNLIYLIEQFDLIRPWEYISGKVSRADYISRYRREYPVIEYANENLPGGARIMALYLGNRTYYSDHPVDCRYSIFFEALNRVKSSDELFRFLRKMGFSNLLVRTDMFREQVDASLGPAAKQRLLEFFQEHLRTLHAANGYALLALVESTAPAVAGGLYKQIYPGAKIQHKDAVSLNVRSKSTPPMLWTKWNAS